MNFNIEISIKKTLQLIVLHSRFSKEKKKEKENEEWNKKNYKSELKEKWI